MASDPKCRRSLPVVFNRSLPNTGRTDVTVFVATDGTGQLLVVLDRRPESPSRRLRRARVRQTTNASYACPTSITSDFILVSAKPARGRHCVVNPVGGSGDSCPRAQVMFSCRLFSTGTAAAELPSCPTYMRIDVINTYRRGCTGELSRPGNNGQKTALREVITSS
ncbi:hypothetical protein BDY19DRAFT_505617 [Irpex rosettiformis]|uniref:Uncharacterized protein n=1 Tax=Irpex rosettiformis TaxID=378272 RepID=A0ACB8UEQ0_9APHY|nr:hypothetical protein BDY19DRAFT_505617 [Irpex rosettiformis]